MKNILKLAYEMREELNALARKSAELDDELAMLSHDLEYSKLVVYTTEDKESCQYCGYQAAYRIDGHKTCTACIPKIGRN